MFSSNQCFLFEFQGSSGNTFKVPQTKLALRQPTIKKLTLVRPSSGYYSMNAKRNDSDTESGRFSSNNVSFRRISNRTVLIFI